MAKKSPADRLLEAISGAQSLALNVTEQALDYTAEHIPAVPGFPSDILKAPTDMVDGVFEQIEEAVGDRAPAVRDVLHMQSTFIKGVFGSLQPIVDALAGEGDESEE